MHLQRCTYWTLDLKSAGQRRQRRLAAHKSFIVSFVAHIDRLTPPVNALAEINQRAKRSYECRHLSQRVKRF
jgi:hypothetical protein